MVFSPPGHQGTKPVRGIKIIFFQNTYGTLDLPTFIYRNLPNLLPCPFPWLMVTGSCGTSQHAFPAIIGVSPDICGEQRLKVVVGILEFKLQLVAKAGKGKRDQAITY